MMLIHWIFVLMVYSAFAKEECEKSVREDRCAEIFVNITNCNEESYRTQLMDCLVTCGKCGAFTCNNAQSDAVLNCTALAAQCESPIWKHLLKDKCPYTCGKCDVKNANLCKDASDTVICSSMVQFCNSLDYYDQMTEQCASTCNRCPNVAPPVTPTCVDYAKDCTSRIGLCSNPQYDGLMHRACAKTCNKCSGCYDNSNSCQQWAARGFCNQHDKGMKMKFCAKTCSLC